jgi:hypothetical protein
MENDMIIVTNDDKEYLPVLFGKIDCPDITDVITCIRNVSPFERDMFNNVVHHRLSIKDIKGFKGTLQMTPVNLLKK